MEEFSKTPLHYCSALNNGHEQVLFLLEKGADYNLKDETGKTSLDLAKDLENKETIIVFENWIQDQKSEFTNSVELLVKKYKEMEMEMEYFKENERLKEEFFLKMNERDQEVQRLKEINIELEKKYEKMALAWEISDQNINYEIGLKEDAMDLLKIENKRLHHEIENLEKSLSLKLDEIKSLKDDHEIIEEKFEILKKEKDDLEIDFTSKIKSSKDDHEIIKEKFEILKKEKDDLEIDFTSKIKSKKDEIQSLKIKLMIETSTLFKLTSPKMKDFKIGKRLGIKFENEEKEEIKEEEEMYYHGVCSSVYEVEYLEKKFAMKVLFNYDNTKDSINIRQKLDNETSFLTNQKLLPWIPEILPIYHYFIDQVDTNKMKWGYDPKYVNVKTLLIITPIGTINLQNLITMRQTIHTDQYFSDQEMILLMKQMLTAVSHLKKHHIVHRDIKPDNFIFLDDQYKNIALIDFGFALNEITDCELNGNSYLFRYPKNTLPGGAPYYLAPEITNTKPGKDSFLDYSKNDDFSLGLVFYEMLSKVKPFFNVSQENWSDENRINLSDVYSDKIKYIIYGLLKVKQHDRMTVDEALKELEKI